MVITPTASGKTLCYNAPVLHAILQDPSSRALYLFPTKALAQDQLAELQAMCETIARDGRAIGVFTYDGDTPQDARRTIRSRAHLVLSNPDMVHSGILPHHPRWAKLFENLRYVIIDELHAYRGVFGSHLCNVLRRLRRICRHYGSNPVFLCSSATIANPRELAERLTEQPFELVDKSGAPRGEKFFVFVNPPVVNHQLGIRRSYLGETRRIASEFLKRNLQLIVFAQSRLSTEILTTYLKDDFEGIPGAPERIRGYRGGYLPLRRREIEKGLREGAVRAVVSTNALELGIDIGALDVVGHGRLSGHDRRDVAARRPRRPAQRPIGGGDGGQQRAARSVRRPQPVVLLRRVARARAHRSRQPAHPRRSHQVRGVRAAVQPDRQRSAGPTCRRSWASWPSRGSCTGRTRTRRGPGRTSRIRPTRSACGRSRRTTSSSSTPRNETRVIGETDFTSGPATLHPKAIYIVEGQLYPGGAARLRGAQGVRARDRLRLLHDGDHLHEGDADRHVRGQTGSGRAVRSHGEVHVVSRVVGFKKIKFYTNENVGSGELDLPEQQMHTTSYWLTIPASVMALLPYASDDRRDGVVGLAFALQAGRAAAADVRRPRHRHLDRQRRDDGADTASPSCADDLRLRQLSGRHRLQRAAVSRCTTSCSTGTRRLIAECECENGCPGCVGPIGNTGPLAKAAALRILDPAARGRRGHMGDSGHNGRASGADAEVMPF